MTAYTETFGGGTIYPADPSYLALALSADTTLVWPLNAPPDGTILARIIDVTPSAGSLSVTLPDATQGSTGFTVLFRNAGSDTFTVKDSAGSTVLTIADGESWQAYLSSNSTAAGTWRTFQAGSVLSQAQAATLAGYGLTPSGATLAQDRPVSAFNTTYTAGAADRAQVLVWDASGSGTLNLTSASTLGNGWFTSVRNEGGGNLTIDPASSETINGDTTLVLRPGDSVDITTDGTSFYTIGFGQAAVFAFDYTSISLTGQATPYTLSGAELNRIAYKFVGTLTADMTIYVPKTTQQYWVANDTTGGSYTLSIATSTQASPLTVTRGARGIYYCDGTDVIKADTSSTALPIGLGDGGTGATNASGARVNLGGTATGIAVFTAATAAAARSALGSTTVGDAVFIAASASAARSALGATAVGEGVFTAASASAARSTLSAAASGSNSDITALTYASGLMIGAPTGGAQGSGTLNATGLFINGVAVGTGSGSVTSVAASGGTTGLSFSGSPITTSGTLTLTGTLNVANGGTGATTLTGLVKGNGTSAFSAATAGTDYVAPATATTFTAKQTFTGSSSILAAKFTNALETITISATAATGTIAYDITSQSIVYYTSNAAANWTINLRASSGTSLNTAMATGEAITVVHMVTQGATAYYNSTVQVDGTTSGVTTKWQGSAPTAGHASSIDVYTYTIIKTANAAFTVIASQTQFA